jgi:hypothetical protein
MLQYGSSLPPDQEGLNYQAADCFQGIYGIFSWWRSEPLPIQGCQRSGENQRESMRAARVQKEAEQRSAADRLEEAVSTAYHKFVEKGKDQLTVPDLKPIVKFIMALEEHEGARSLS